MGTDLSPFLLVALALIIPFVVGICAAGFARYWGWPVIARGITLTLSPAVLILFAESENARGLAVVVAIVSGMLFFFGFFASMLLGGGFHMNRLNANWSAYMDSQQQVAAARPLLAGREP